jgi:hypothetical protein
MRRHRFRYHLAEVPVLPGPVVVSGVGVEDLLPHPIFGKADPMVGPRLGREVHQTGNDLPLAVVAQVGEDVSAAIISVDPGEACGIVV